MKEIISGHRLLKFKDCLKSYWDSVLRDLNHKFRSVNLNIFKQTSAFFVTNIILAALIVSTFLRHIN